MAETVKHTYEIIVRMKNGGGNSNVSGASPQSNSSNGIKEKASDFIVFNEAKSFGKQAVSFAVSNVGLMTGNSESQALIDFHANLFSTIGIALFTGNIAAAMLTVAHQMTNALFKSQQIHLEQRIESESLSVSRTRAGIAFNRSRMNGSF